MQFSKEPYISAAKISISPQTTKDLRGKSVTRGRRIQNTKYSLFSAASSFVLQSITIYLLSDFCFLHYKLIYSS